MRPTVQDPAGEPGEDPARPGLHEDPYSGRVHRLDLFDEPDGLGDLAGEGLPHRVGGVRIRLRGHVRPDRDRRRRNGDLVQVGGEHPGRGRDHRAVERACHRDPPDGEAFGRQELRRGVHRGSRTGDHGLFRCVVIGDHDIGQVRRAHAQRFSNPLRRGSNRRHRPGVGGCGESIGGIEDGDRSRLAQRQQIGGVDGSGRAQGDQFTVAVAAEMVGTHAEAGEDLVHGETGDPEGRLCRPGIGDRRLLGVGVPTAERGRREHRLHPLLTAFEQVPQAREGHEQLRQHPGPLAALAREQEGDLSFRGSFPDAALRSAAASAGDEDPGLRVVGERACPLHQVGKLVQAGRDERHLDGPAALGRHCRGQVTQLPGTPGAVVDPDQLGEPVQGAAGGCLVGATDDEQFRGPGVQPVGGFGSTVIGGQHHVEVGPAEPERGHPGMPPRRRCRPRPGAGVEEERAGLGVPGRVRLGDVEGRRAHTDLQRLHGLDQTGQPGGTLGVSYLRLHRADGATFL